MSNKSDNSSILLMLNEEVKMNDFAALIYLGVVMVLGSLSNAFSFYIFYYKMTATTGNLFIAVLSFSNFLGSLVCVLLDIIVIINPYTFNNDIGCRIIRFLVMDDVVISALVVFTISVDRFKNVVLPLRQQITHRQVGYICAAIVIVSTTISLPCFYVYSTQPVTTHRLNMTGMQCTLSDKVQGRKLYISFLFSVCILVLVALCTIYCIIGIKLYRYKTKQQSRMSLKSPGTSSLEREGSAVNDMKCYNEGCQLSDEMKRVKSSTDATEKEQSRRTIKKMNTTRTTLMIFLVSLSWVISFLPHLIAVNLLAMKPHMKDTMRQTEHALYTISTRSFYFSHVVDPWLYGIFNFRFREEMFSLLRKATCR